MVPPGIPRPLGPCDVRRIWLSRSSPITLARPLRDCTGFRRTIALSCELWHSRGSAVNRPPVRSALGRARHVQDHLEFEQRGTGGDRLRALAGVGLPCRAVAPCDERFFVLPLGDHEVAVLAFDRSEQLESEEPRGILYGVRTVREPRLQFGAGALGDFDC